jgi:hypothetical protein
MKIYQGFFGRRSDAFGLILHKGIFADFLLKNTDFTNGRF